MAEMEEFGSRIVEAGLQKCFSDFCWIGTQFCSFIARRCEYCNAHHHSCFTNLQEKNCTQYCMDQWIQNYEFQKAKNEEDNGLYKWLFFILLAINLVILIGLPTACACSARFRMFVNSVIDSLRSNIAGTVAPCLLCVQPSTVSNGHVIRNSPTLAAHQTRFLQPNISPQSIAQNNVSDANRQDGDGHSQFERSDREFRERRGHNIQAQLQAQSQSSNMISKVPVTRMQHLTKTKSRTASTATASHRGKEATPLMTTISDEHPLSNGTVDSVTHAKQLCNVGDHSQRNGMRNPPVDSNSYRAMNFVLSDDTGYNTNACS